MNNKLKAETYKNNEMIGIKHFSIDNLNKEVFNYFIPLFDNGIKQTIFIFISNEKYSLLSDDTKSSSTNLSNTDLSVDEILKEDLIFVTSNIVDRLEAFELISLVKEYINSVVYIIIK